MLIVYRDKIQQISECSSLHSMQALKLLIMDCLTLSKVLGGCKWLVRYQKREGKTSLHFHLELNILEVLRPLTDTNLKHRGREHVGVAPGKLFAEV